MDMKEECLVRQLDEGPAISGDHFEHAFAPPYHVNLIVEVRARHVRLSRLQLLLLLTNPVPFRRHEPADGLGAHPQRCGDPHLANRWVDAQAEILDSLVNDIDNDIVQLDLCEHSVTRLLLSALSLSAQAKACALHSGYQLPATSYQLPASFIP